MKTWIVLFFAVLTLAVLFTDPPAIAQEKQTVVDPKTLIGEWWGGWVSSTGKVTGQFYLTISRVEDGDVIGVVEVANTPLAPREDFKGTIIGDELSFSTPTRKVNLKIDGKKMYGFGQALVGQQYRYEIKVYKRK